MQLDGVDPNIGPIVGKQAGCVCVKTVLPVKHVFTDSANVVPDRNPRVFRGLITTVVPACTVGQEAVGRLNDRAQSARVVFVCEGVADGLLIADQPQLFVSRGEEELREIVIRERNREAGVRGLCCARRHLAVYIDASEFVSGLVPGVA